MKSCGRAVAGGRREEAGHLVAPRRIERVLGDRHQLDVGEAAAADVRGQLGGELAVAEPAVLLLGDAHPRPEVHLVDRIGASSAVRARRALHPVAVAPGVVEVPDDRGGRRRQLAAEAVGVGLVDAVAAAAARRSGTCSASPCEAGDEPLPDPRVPRGRERGGARAPALEVADHMDARRVRGPDGEVDAATPARGRPRCAPSRS